MVKIENPGVFIMQFQHPFTSVLVGGTGSGKSFWLRKFLSNLDKLISKPITHTLYCYGELNDIILGYQAQSNITLHKGVPALSYVKELRKNGPLLLILDDLMLDLKTQYLGDLFSKISHNWDISVILVCQDLFCKNTTTVKRNSHYFCLMRSPSSELQTRIIGQQLFPKKLNFFLESFHDATFLPFTYCVIDMHPQTPVNERLKTNIFPDEYMITYVPRENNI